jgi:hypothetical protein
MNGHRGTEVAAIEVLQANLLYEALGGVGRLEVHHG